MALLLDMFLLVVSTHAQSEHPRCPSKGLGNLSNMVYRMQLGHVRNPESMWSLAGDHRHAADRYGSLSILGIIPAT